MNAWGMRTPLELPMGANFTFMAGFPERKRSQGNYAGIPPSTPRIRHPPGGSGMMRTGTRDHDFAGVPGPAGNVPGTDPITIFDAGT